MGAAGRADVGDSAGAMRRVGLFAPSTTSAAAFLLMRCSRSELIDLGSRSFWRVALMGGDDSQVAAIDDDLLRGNAHRRARLPGACWRIG